MTFQDLQLIKPLLRAVRDEGYNEPTPIQTEAIPHVCAGRDVLANAQTGTGKTAAFALPALQHLIKQKSGQSKQKRTIHTLVLSPTRELATQIGDNFRAYGRYTPAKTLTIFGGVNAKRQIDQLQRGVDVLVATPGRLLDLMNQGYVRLDRLEILVLDEADRMLDMGFLPDMRRIISKLPNKRQTLLFSATMPPNIQKLAQSIMSNPVHVEVAPESTTVEAIDQAIYFVEKKQKRALLVHLLTSESVDRALVFTRTKHGANRLVKQLGKASINAEAIHGNKSQRAREQALANFKNSRITILVATDIAARGIDVDNISHVFNYDLPNDSESYVHRIGRTGRAGATGQAISFCSEDERDYLIKIERLIQMNIPVIEDQPFMSQLGLPTPTDLNPQRRRPQQKNNRSRSNSRRSRPQKGRNRRQSQRQYNSQPQ